MGRTRQPALRDRDRDDDAERARGLMFRDALPTGHGMLFIHDAEEPQAYWMKNTKIPLDILYFDDGASWSRSNATSRPARSAMAALVPQRCAGAPRAGVERRRGRPTAAQDGAELRFGGHPACEMKRGVAQAQACIGSKSSTDPAIGAGQVSGTSSQRVPGAMPSSGNPSASS